MVGGFFFDESVDGTGCDCEGSWGCHICGLIFSCFVWRVRDVVVSGGWRCFVAKSRGSGLVALLTDIAFLFYVQPFFFLCILPRPNSLPNSGCADKN